MVRSKRLLSLITSLALAISLFQFGALPAEAAPKAIQRLELKSDFPEVIRVDERVAGTGTVMDYDQYKLTTSGTYAAKFSGGQWRKKQEDGNFNWFTNPWFEGGDYRFHATITLTNSNNYLTEDTEVIINGKTWEIESLESNSEIKVFSPAITAIYNYDLFVADVRNKLELSKRDSEKVTAFIDQALDEGKIVKTEDNFYDLNDDEQPDVKIIYDFEKECLVMETLPDTSLEGTFTISVDPEKLEENEIPCFEKLQFEFPVQGDPHDLGTLEINLTDGVVGLTGSEYEAFSLTLGSSKWKKESDIDEIYYSTLDVDNDGQWDFYYCDKLEGYGASIGMHPECTIRGDELVYELDSEERARARVMEKDYYSVVHFIVAEQALPDNLGEYIIDLRNGSATFAGEMAYFLMFSLNKMGYISKTADTRLYVDVRNEDTNVVTYNLELDYDGTGNIAYDVVMVATKTPELSVKVTPLTTSTIEYQETLTSGTGLYNLWHHGYFGDLTFIFKDYPVVPDPVDPNNPTNPTNPTDPGNPANPTNPTNPSGNGTAPAPTVANQAPVHAVGESVANGGASYSISSVTAGSEAVTYVKPDSATASSATVPNDILIDGTSYKVTGIAAGAFQNNKKLKKVTIGANVASIGSKAFYKCKNLKNIKVNTVLLTKSSVGGSAFKGIHSKAKVKVPKKQLKNYKKIFKSKGLKGKNQKVK
ncbi:leucine-rich repeat protein [Butyrivibrio sp. VCD2006]|uniref:leucine-rich repeat protein n=1 Tax=Butyrivibrio sp. VCD2006 TaxID=1280664 RepID=UPI00047B8E4C|nr:leucine-rich repeat protein [Butyrivibrio sp. VCD2006]